MRIIQTRRAFAFVLAATIAVGCSASAPARFYTLDSTATAGGAPTVTGIIEVGPVSIPAAVDRSQFVVQVAPNRVEIDEFNLWAAPLTDNIARAVAGDLSALLGTPDVAVGPTVGITPAYRVTLDVQRFESVAGKEALVDVVWVVRGRPDNATRPGRTVSRETVTGPGFEALAAAHSRALAHVSAEIAEAIRATAAAPPSAAHPKRDQR